MNKNAIRWTPIALLMLLAANPAAWAQRVDATNPAQGYPNKPIRWIIDFGAGGLSDTLARSVAVKLTEAWEKPVINDARPGANGTIAYNLGSKATPDGYTLVFLSTPFSINKPTRSPRAGSRTRYWRTSRRADASTAHRCPRARPVRHHAG